MGTAVLAALLLLAQGGAESQERLVFELVNRERAAAGLPALAWDEGAARAARAHSRRMRDKGFFSHQDPALGNVARRLTAAGIAWTAVAENIFSARGYRRPAEAAARAWMKSRPHRRNILDRRYTRTGVGVAAARDGTYFFTQIYLRP